MHATRKRDSCEPRAIAASFCDYNTHQEEIKNQKGPPVRTALVKVRLMATVIEMQQLLLTYR